MSTHDLGTYHLRVELTDGRGWIETWHTHARYTNGTSAWSPLTATRIGCLYENEAAVFEAMQYMYTQGNYSCDCNKTLAWCRSQQREEPETVCGNTMTLATLTAIRPDGSECTLVVEGSTTSAPHKTGSGSDTETKSADR
jgi:hypothetical protein